MNAQKIEDNKDIELSRDCEAILIPHGLPVTMVSGEKVTIMQQLGGSFTVYYNGNLARVDGNDADALGLEVPKDFISDSSIDSSDSNLDNDENIQYSKFKKIDKTIVGNGIADEQEVWKQLRNCYDPEIPVNIVDLGLIYECELMPVEPGSPKSGTRVEVKMTLTAPGCGMGPFIVDDVYSKVLAVDNVLEAKVELVWDPQWSQDLMSEEAQLTLGLL